jgi:uncharacterized protein YkwD
MHRIRRFAPLAIALLSFAAIGGPTAVSATTVTDQAEADLIRLLNRDRAEAGLVPLQRYSRLMAIAGARSYDMATKHYFSHRQPDGRTAFDMIDATGITWYLAAEDIAWNNYGDLRGSAIMANNQWMASSAHRAAIMSSSYNYVGVGVSIDKSNGHKLWTAIFLKKPDHTGGWVQFNQTSDSGTTQSGSTTTNSVSTTETSGPRSITVSWQGGDVRLSTLTSGFDHYQIRKKTDSGLWTWVTRSTTSRSRTFTAYPGHRYYLAVRACDRRGNCGVWRYISVAG